MVTAVYRSPKGDFLSFPNQKRLMDPLLWCTARRGGTICTRSDLGEIEDELADHFRLTPEHRGVFVPSQREPKGRDDIRWARKKLLSQGLLERSLRGQWTVSNRGYQHILHMTAVRIVNAMLENGLLKLF